MPRLLPVASSLPAAPLLADLAVHQSVVHALLYLPDGRLLSGSEDSSIAVWRGDRLERRFFEAGPINHLALGGNRWLAALDDSTLRVRDADTLEPLRVIHGHDGYVRRAAFAGTDPENPVIVSGSADHKVGFDGQLRHAHNDWVEALAISPDGRRAVTGSITGGMVVWDVERAAAERVLAADTTARRVLGMPVTPKLDVHGGHTEPPNVFLWPTPDRFISVGKEIVVWDTAGWTPILRLEADSMGVRSAVCLDGGRTLITVGGAVKVWNLANGGQPIADFVGHEGTPIHSVAVRSDGAVLATGDRHGRVRLWDLRQLLASTGAPEGHTSGIRLPLLVSPDEQWVVSGGNGDHGAILWSCATSRPVHRWPASHDDQFVSPIGFWRDSVLTTARDEIVVWSLAEGTRLRTVRSGGKFSDKTACMVEDDSVLFGDVSTALARLDPASGHVTPLANGIAHPIGIDRLGDDRLAVTSYRGKEASPVAILSRATGEVLRELHPSAAPGTAPRFRILCSAVVDGVVYGAVAPAPDQGSPDGLLCAWNPDTGEVIAQLSIGVGQVASRIWGLPDGHLAVLRALPGILWVASPDLSEVEQHDVAPILWYHEVSADGTWLVARDDEDEVVLVSLPACRIVARYTPAAKVNALAIRGRTVAVGTGDGQVEVLRIADGDA